MNCPDWQQLNLYFDGESLDESIRSHIDECLHCRSQLKKLEQLDTVVTAPPGTRSARRFVRHRWRLVAAAVLLVGGLGLAIRPATATRSVHRMATQDGTVYTISTTGQAQILSLEVNGQLAKPEEH